MSIAANSSSYPVLGAADAAGVEYGLALAYVAASDLGGADRVYWSICVEHGDETAEELIGLLDLAVAQGRLAPFRRGEA